MTLTVTTASAGDVTLTFGTSVPENYIDLSIASSDTIPEVLVSSQAIIVRVQCEMGYVAGTTRAHTQPHPR